MEYVRIFVYTAPKTRNNNQRKREIESNQDTFKHVAFYDVSYGKVIVRNNGTSFQ